MTKRLMIGLLTGVLVATMLPGVAVAKDKDDKSPCKAGAWTDWVREDGSAFADQGECVAYVAEGGTLAEPMSKTPFAVACEGVGGTYQAPLWDSPYYPQGCFWTEIALADYEAAGPALWGTCPVGAGMTGGRSPSPWYACDLGDD